LQEQAKLPDCDTEIYEIVFSKIYELKLMRLMKLPSLFEFANLKLEQSSMKSMVDEINDSNQVLKGLW
jgi:hypothetical protein